MDEVAFSQASEWYRQRGKGFSYSAKLKLYGLFKQATVGDAPDESSKAGLRAGGSFWQAPSWRLDRAEGWAAHKGKSQAEARWAYIACVQENDPNFTPSVHGNASQLAEAAAATALAAEAAAKGLPPPPFTVTDSVFETAVEEVGSMKSQLGGAAKLGFYGLFKQAKLGDNNTPRPGLLDPVGGAKWDAWYSRRGLSTNEAKDMYVASVLLEDPNWGSRNGFLVSGESDDQRDDPPDLWALSEGPSPQSASGNGYVGNGSGQDEQYGMSPRKSNPPDVFSRHQPLRSGNRSLSQPDSMDADSLPPPRLERSSESVEAAAASARRLRLGSDPAYKEGFGANGDGSAEALPSSAATLHSSPRALQSSSASSFLSSSSSGMRGWLHKMQEREVNVLLWGGSGSRWEPRLFVLQGGSLQYYRGEHDATPRGMFALHRCVVLKEGEKKLRRGKTFHVLALYLHGAEGTSRGPSSGALLRVSSESSDWIDAWARALLPRCQNAASGFAAPLLTPLPNNSGDLKHNKSKSLASLQLAHEPAPASANSQHGSSPSLLSSDSQQQPPVSPSGAPPPVAYAMKRDGSKEEGSQEAKDSENGASGKEAAVTAATTKEGDAPTKEVEPTEVPAVPTGAEPPPTPRPRGGFPASKPMHRCTQPSFLSAEESSKQNYRGLFNLAALILVVSNLRMFLKNFLIYGLLIRLPELSAAVSFQSISFHPLDHPYLCCYLLHHCCLFAAYGIESFATRHPSMPYERIVRLANMVNILTSLALPTAVVWAVGGSSSSDSSDAVCSAHQNANVDGTSTCDNGRIAIISGVSLGRSADPMAASVLIFATIILFMKLVSYAHVNNDYRQAAREAANLPMDQVDALIAKFTNTVSDTEGLMVRYPYNVGLQDLYYFWAAPTLTYQLNFPRSPTRRGWMVYSLLIRIAGCVSLMVFLTQQHVMPSVVEATASIDRLEPWHILERLLYVAMPVTYLWLLMFYLIFHLFLNLLAELLRFGDRVFYKDWWNATTFEEYWRLWNLPVHYWMVRHLYFPLVRAGFNRGQCVFAIFLFSAAFHELLVSVPFHMLRVYSFAAMLGQIPLVAITKQLQERFPLWRETGAGNFLFWCTFCIVGQPMAVLLYYYDSQVRAQQSTGSVASAAFLHWASQAQQTISTALTPQI